jgi:hypothetical protein
MTFRTRLATDTARREQPFLSLSHGQERLGILVAAGSDTRGTVEVFDVAGRRVRSFGSLRFGMDTTRIDWNLRDDGGLLVPSGLYVVQAHVGARNARQKTVILH